MSVTCGQGHNSTAKALMKKLVEYGVECEFLDAFEHINKILAKAIDNGYQLSTKFFSDPYAEVYKKLERRKKNADDMSSFRLMNTLLSSKLRSFIEEYDPDVIVTTHCFASAMVDILKEKGIIHSVNIGIVTDFTVHPYWEESLHFDYIVLPNELLEQQLIKKGFNKKQILPFGIPIDPKFSAPSTEREVLLERMGLDPKKLTLLIMSGSMGFGNIKQVVSSIDKIKLDFQAIVVCGNNADAKEKIDDMRKSKTFVTYGFVNNVEELMSVSDIILTKPGGLTSSEALAMNLPMVLINPIPGQEDRNLEFLLNNGAAVSVTETSPVDEVLFQLMYHSERIGLMKKSISFIRKPDSTDSLASFISNLDI